MDITQDYLQKLAHSAAVNYARSEARDTGRICIQCDGEFEQYAPKILQLVQRCLDSLVREGELIQIPDVEISDRDSDGAYSFDMAYYLKRRSIPEEIAKRIDSPPSFPPIGSYLGSRFLQKV